MIQNIILQRIQRNALAVAKFEKIRKADERKVFLSRPKLLPPKFSQAEVAFLLSLEN